MFCNKCGKELIDGAAFCTYCGAAVAAPVQPQGAETPAYEIVDTPAYEVAAEPVAETPAYETPAYEAPAYTAPAQQYSAPQQYTASARQYASPQQFETAQYTAPVEGNPEAGGALAMGIVSCCLCWLPVVSIILGAIGIKKSGRAMWYANHGGGKKALGIIGKVFSIIGLAFGAFFTFYWLIILITALSIVLSA